MTTKQAVIDIIRRLPEDVTVTDILAELYVRQTTAEDLQRDSTDGVGPQEGVAQRDGSPAVDDSWDDILDHGIIAASEREAEGEVSLEELRRLLSSIKGSMSDVIIEERGEY